MKRVDSSAGFYSKTLSETSRDRYTANSHRCGKTKCNPRTSVVLDQRTVSKRARQREIIQVHNNNPGRGKTQPETGKARFMTMAMTKTMTKTIHSCSYRFSLSHTHTHTHTHKHTNGLNIHTICCSIFEHVFQSLKTVGHYKV